MHTAALKGNLEALQYILIQNPLGVNDQDKPIGANPKFTVTERPNASSMAKVPIGLTVIEHHKVIAGALVLEKVDVLG